MTTIRSLQTYVDLFQQTVFLLAFFLALALVADVNFVLTRIEIIMQLCRVTKVRRRKKMERGR